VFLELFVLKNVWLQYTESAEAMQSANDFHQLFQTSFIQFTNVGCEKNNSYISTTKVSISSRRVYACG